MRRISNLTDLASTFGILRTGATTKWLSLQYDCCRSLNQILGRLQAKRCPMMEAPVFKWDPLKMQK